MSRRIPVLETDRLIIRELTTDDLEPINNVLNRSFGSEMSIGECQRWLQWAVLGYEMFAMLEQPHYGGTGRYLKRNKGDNRRGGYGAVFGYIQQGRGVRLEI